MRKLHPEMGVGDIAKELGKLWMSTDLQTKSKYMAIAEEDRARYERVIVHRYIKNLCKIKFNKFVFSFSQGNHCIQ